MTEFSYKSVCNPEFSYKPVCNPEMTEFSYKPVWQTIILQLIKPFTCIFNHMTYLMGHACDLLS